MSTTLKSLALMIILPASLAVFASPQLEALKDNWAGEKVGLPTTREEWEKWKTKDLDSLKTMVENPPDDIARICLERGTSWLAYGTAALFPKIKALRGEYEGIVWSGFSLGTELMMSTASLDNGPKDVFIYNDFLCRSKERLIVMDREPNGLRNITPGYFTKLNTTEWFLRELEVGCFLAPEGLEVRREVAMDGADRIERFTFENTGAGEVSLGEVRIFQPWNDNYPDSETCLTNRVHAHIFARGPHAWVEAVRMDGQEILGYMLTNGALDGYAIFGRARKTGSSNTRGVIALIPESRTLKLGEKYTLEGRYFPVPSRAEFPAEIMKRGGTWISADKYAGEVGETVKICRATSEGIKTEEVTLELGEMQTEDGVELLGLPPIKELAKARVEFILRHQLVVDPASELYGAFLPYDNETGKIYYNEEMPILRPDCNEGRERVGMGVLLVRYARRFGDDSGEITAALKDYARFLRTKLQDEEYRVYSSISRREEPRVYNYPWIARFYAELAELTGEAQYRVDAIETMKAAYREQGGSAFYMIGVPIRELPELKELYRKTADFILANGARVPPFEVNYEQSIVAPAVTFLLDFYALSEEEKYLKGVHEMMNALEAFNGHQPSWHLNDIAIRHWDGYWFGKYQHWGDTMPHYWSALSAEAFARYAEATGDCEYAARAKAILKQNLGAFDSKGSATCAYLYPNEVNGLKVKGKDPLANDQDWALALHLKFFDLK